MVFKHKSHPTINPILLSIVPNEAITLVDTTTIQTNIVCFFIKLCNLMTRLTWRTAGTLAELLIAKIVTINTAVAIRLFQNSQLTVLILLTVQIDGAKENVTSPGGSNRTVTVNNRQLSIKVINLITSNMIVQI